MCDQLTLLLIDRHQAFSERLRDTLVSYCATAKVLHFNDIVSATNFLSSSDLYVNLIFLHSELINSTPRIEAGAFEAASLDVPRVLIVENGVLITDEEFQLFNVKGIVSYGLNKRSLLNIIQKIKYEKIEILSSGSQNFFLSNDYSDDGDSLQILSERWNLTGMQVRTLGKILEGKANKIIAHELGISIVTVKRHVSALLCKMGVKSRTQAVLMATHWLSVRRVQTVGRVEFQPAFAERV